jgi:type III secretion system FlhB-like substrate exporter
MELELIKINRHGEDNSMVRMSLEAHYGWKDNMCRDIIQINYNGKKREAFITVKLLHPGAGKIADRIIETVTEIDFTARSVKNPPLLILETLAEKLSLRYNDQEARDALSGI